MVLLAAMVAVDLADSLLTVIEAGAAVSKVGTSVVDFVERLVDRGCHATEEWAEAVLAFVGIDLQRPGTAAEAVAVVTVGLKGKVGHKGPISVSSVGPSSNRREKEHMMLIKVCFRSFFCTVIVMQYF